MRAALLPRAKGGAAIEGLAPRNRVCRASFLSTAVLLAAVSASAAALYHVAQKNRAFEVDQITIARGDTIAFSNNDEFLHQIYVDSASFTFDSAEQHPREMINVTFSQAGTFAVRCHIHPKMVLVVHVN